jgi:hypothetical protein
MIARNTFHPDKHWATYAQDAYKNALGLCVVSIIIANRFYGNGNVLTYFSKIWGSHSCGYEDFYLLRYNAV